MPPSSKATIADRPRSRRWLSADPCQPAAHLGENLRRGGVATKIVINLALAVIVTGPSDQQAEAPGKITEPASGLRVVILVIHLDPVETMIICQGLEHLCRQDPF